MVSYLYDPTGLSSSTCVASKTMLFLSRSASCLSNALHIGVDQVHQTRADHPQTSEVIQSLHVCSVARIMVNPRLQGSLLFAIPLELLLDGLTLPDKE